MFNKLIAALLPYMPQSFVWVFSKRYVAGLAIDEAIKGCKELNSEGILVTLDVLGEFIKTLEEAGYQTQDVEVHQFGADDVEIQAVLTASAVNGDDMDRLIAKIADQDFVSQAFWSPSTTD